MPETTFYIFNEDGLIGGNELEAFCEEFQKRTDSGFKVTKRDSIAPQSTIYKKFYTEKLEFTLFDHGYVMKVDGDINEAMTLLKDIDLILNKDVLFFVSPSQRVENSIENKFPRGSTANEIAEFLDRQFRNQDYTSALTNR